MGAVALIAFCVIFAVIARYFFGISFTFLEEFITTVFAFTTFWGIGICFIEDEHVTIDSLYSIFPSKFKTIVTIFNYLIVTLITIVMIKYGLSYTIKYGWQISMGMRIPMYWMYGIIPLGCFISLVCVLVKFGCYIVLLKNKEL